MSNGLPVTLLSGFLGSGKTTMINHILTQPSGLRIGVVVNEFGEIGIDGALVSQEASGLIEIRGGCVCCVNRGDLGRAVTDLVGSGRELDHILVETSGLTDPGPAIAVLSAPPLVAKMSFSGTVSLVDAANFDRNLEYAEAAYNQITYADLLVINKSDLVSPETIDQIRAGLHLLNQSAPIITAVDSAVPIELILGKKDWDLGRHSAAPGQTHQHQFTAINVRTTRPLDLAKLTDWVASLSRSVPRVKGIVRLQGSGKMVAVQSVAGNLSVSDLPAGGWPESGESVVTVIGVADDRRIDRSRLQQELQECAS